MTDEINNTEGNEEEFDVLDFLDNQEFQFEDPLEGDERAVTLRTSGGSQSVVWREGLTLQEAISEANIVMQTRAVFYLDDAEIEMESVLPAGATVTAIGASQKGG